ncbi:D-2-hydroxyacid dehydrogenase [Atopococcus tabaci]|uniref:D-2-hydroxyacid dehydrogenase n=1 Tax=Atopococcus tabaci TaxID=269774 RepID=UPI000421909D|nr:D-2-hydroxyacid dehydrogenase [Atopococcus tabaci]
MNIVVLEGYTTNPGDLSWKELEELGEVTLYDRTSLEDEAEAIERIGEAELVFTNKVPITQTVLEACANIRFIGVLATGYNVVDIEAARERGITVSNVPDYSTDSVAQHTFALLLEITNQVAHHSREVHNGKWEHHEDWTFYDYPLMELSGKTIGILGFGKIGQAVGKLARAFGMNVLAYNRSESESGRQIANYVSKEELLAQADVLSLHLPLTEKTKEIINADAIRQMKDGVILLNTGRGPLINEHDVAEALNEGKIYAAGLDVVSTESIQSDNPLLKAQNCFITPHIAWATKESRQRLIDISVENARAFLRGQPVNEVGY